MRPEYKEFQSLNDKEENSKWVSDKTELLAKEFNDEYFIVVKTEPRKGVREHNGTNKGRNKRYDKCFAAHLMPLLGADETLYVCCQLQNKKQLPFCCIEKNISAGKILKVWESQKRIDTINNINVHECPDCRFDKLNEFLYHVYMNKNEREIIRGILDYYKGVLNDEKYDNITDKYATLSQKKELTWNMQDIKEYLFSIDFSANEEDWNDNVSPFLL